MKSILGFLIIIISGYFAQMFLVWWSIAAIAFLIGFLMRNRANSSFWTGFFAVFCLWGAMAFWLNMQNEGVLAARLGDLFGGSPSIVLVLVTALLGGILGGMSTMTGSLGRDWVTPFKKDVSNPEKS